MSGVGARERPAWAWDRVGFTVGKSHFVWVSVPAVLMREWTKSGNSNTEPGLCGPRALPVPESAVTMGTVTRECQLGSKPGQVGRRAHEAVPGRGTRADLPEAGGGAAAVTSCGWRQAIPRCRSRSVWSVGADSTPESGSPPARGLWVGGAPRAGPDRSGKAPGGQGRGTTPGPRPWRGQRAAAAVTAASPPAPACAAARSTTAAATTA